jgi:hypothetical protein
MLTFHTPKEVTITFGHHEGQKGIWLHTFQGKPMVRLHDHSAVSVPTEHLKVLGEAQFTHIEVKPEKKRNQGKSILGRAGAAA